MVLAIGSSTILGKKLELPVKKIFQGWAVDAVISRDAMANPDSLDEYLGLAQQPQP